VKGVVTAVEALLKKHFFYSIKRERERVKNSTIKKDIPFQRGVDVTVYEYCVERLVQS
jgi:hypothetical protein